MSKAGAEDPEAPAGRVRDATRRKASVVVSA
jgi:hypothetical protein